MYRNTFRLFQVSVTLLVLLPLSNSTAQSQARFFTEPPSAEELGTLLYGPRYRSITAPPSGQRLAMMINFKLNSVQVLPESLPFLESLGQMLVQRKASKEVLVIEGHADARGTAHHNLSLSTRRAQAIKDYLVNSFDIAPARLVTVGKGETEPYDVADEKAPINRRVEFRAVQSIIIN